MQKSILTVSVLIFMLFTQALYCSAADTINISTLIEKADELNETEITIEGEVIGEALERGEYAWINVNDGTNAIGVWVKQSDISGIKFYGDYKHKGDTVLITGTFYNSCKEHGGDFDIHSQNIKIEAEGHKTAEIIPTYKLVAAPILIIVALLLSLEYYRFLKKVKAEK